jgi:hypothetical protein
MVELFILKGCGCGPTARLRGLTRDHTAHARMLAGFRRAHFHGGLVKAANANTNMPAREAAVLPLAKCSLATAAESLGQSYSRKHIPADAAWDPHFVFHDLGPIRALRIERAYFGLVPFVHADASSNKAFH